MERKRPFQGPSEGERRSKKPRLTQRELPADLWSEIATFLEPKPQARFSEVGRGFGSLQSPSDLAFLQYSLDHSDISFPPRPYVLEMLSKPAFRNWVKPIASNLVDVKSGISDNHDGIQGIETAIGHPALRQAIQSDEDLSSRLLLSIFGSGWEDEASPQLLEFLAGLVNESNFAHLVSERDVSEIVRLVPYLSKEQLSSEDLVVGLFREFVKNPSASPYRRRFDVARELAESVPPLVWNSIVRNRIQDLFPWDNMGYFPEGTEDEMADLIEAVIPADDSSLAMPILEVMLANDDELYSHRNTYRALSGIVADSLGRLLRQQQYQSSFSDQLAANSVSEEAPTGPF